MDRAEQAGPADVLQFRAGEVTEAGGKVRHTDLTVYQYLAPQFGHLVSTVGLRVRGGLGQTTDAGVAWGRNKATTPPAFLQPERTPACPSKKNAAHVPGDAT